jgi:hypothetical protein
LMTRNLRKGSCRWTTIGQTRMGLICRWLLNLPRSRISSRKIPQLRIFGCHLFLYDTHIVQREHASPFSSLCSIQRVFCSTCRTVNVGHLGSTHILKLTHLQILLLAYSTALTTGI